MKVFNRLYNCLGGGKLRLKSVLTALLAGFFSLIFFSSCENFLNGSLLKDELITVIDYANAPSYEVLVTADEGTGTIIIGSGINKIKVTDYFKIEFRKSSGYKFIEWVAVSKDGKNSMEDYVEFGKKTDLNTTVTLKKGSEDIQIKPLCEPSLSVSEAYPEFKEEGVARDSTIKLVLSAPLSDKNDLSRITIDIDGSNVKGTLHFDEPEIVDNQLVITAKTSNRITVPAGMFKDLTVTIPEDFLYVGGNGEFEIGEPLHHTYRINSTTMDKAFITYGTSEENSGTVKVNGIAAPAVGQQYSIGDTVTVSYKVADGYSFKGWECSDNGAILIKKPENDMYEYDENGYNEITKTATVILTIINETMNATFKAKVEKIPTVNLKFVTSSENSGIIKVNGVTYGGEKREYRLGDVITVTFKKNSEYLFKGVTENNEIYTVEYAAQDSDSFGYDEDTKTATLWLTITTKSTVKEVQTITLNTPEIPWASVDVSSPYGRFSSDASRIYREGEKQTIGFTSDPDYQFVKWQVIDLTTKQDITDSDYIKIADISKANTTFEFNTAPAEDSGIKLSIQPLCAKRPKIVSTTPIYDSDGVYRDRRIAIMFDNEMGDDALYFDQNEIPAEMTKIESLKNPGKYYAYKNGSDDSSIVYKCLAINRRTGRKDNLLKHFSEPYYDPEDKSVIRIDTLRDNPPPASTEILVTVLPTVYQDCKININEKAHVLLGSEYSWAYYTNGKSDNDEPVFGDFDIRFAVGNQAAYDGSAHELVTAAITDSALIKDNNLKSKTLWVKGEFSDGGSGPAGLTWSLRKINSDRFYPEEMDYEVDSGKFEELNIQGSKAEVARKIKNEATGREEFSTDGLSLDLSNGLVEEGMYRIIFTARDKNDLTATKDFFFIYDETPPAKLNGFSESRTESGKATVSWTKPTELDFEKIEIVYTNTKSGVSSAVNEYTTETSALYSVTDLNRYEYTAYVYDWAGNKSEVETFTDLTPPSASTITYVSTQAKDIVTVKKSANSPMDICKTDIENVIFKNGDTKIISNLGNDSRTHTITIKDYDYSGNCTTTTKKISAEVSVGMIYYTDGYYSTDYDSTRTPEGVVCKVASSNKFYIWDIWDQYGYCWGNLNLKKTTSGSVNLAHMDVNVSGVDVYDTLVNNLGETEMLKKGMSRTQKWEDGKLSPTIWSYVLDKNKETKPVNAGVKSEKWFIPSRFELQNIMRNLETMEASFDKILKDNKYSSRVRINDTDYAYRQVKLIEIGGYYWTSMLHWNTDCGAPVTFQKTGALSQNDLWWLGFYDDTSVSSLGSHKYKGDSIILYQSSLDGEKSEELFYMDRCIRRTVYSSALTAEWESAEAKDMKTHAMALVELD